MYRQGISFDPYLYMNPLAAQGTSTSVECVAPYKRQRTCKDFDLQFFAQPLPTTAKGPIRKTKSNGGGGAAAATTGPRRKYNADKGTSKRGGARIVASTSSATLDASDQQQLMQFDEIGMKRVVYYVLYELLYIVLSSLQYIMHLMYCCRYRQ